MMRGTRRHQLWAFVVAVLIVPNLALAQQARTKRPLTHDDYDSWRSVQGQRLSQDGRFLLYALVPQDGDGEIVVRNLSTGSEWRHGIGSRQAPVASDDEEAPAAAGPAPYRALFTADGGFAVFQILPTKAEIDKARIDKKKPEDGPKNALGIMNLANGTVARIERVKSFQVPEDRAGFVVYLHEPASGQSKSASTEASSSSAPAAGTSRRVEYGSELVLRSLADNSSRAFPDVLEFSFSKDGRHLVYAVSSKNDQSNGVYAAAADGASTPLALLTGKGRYSRISWDTRQTQLAFISDRDDASSAQPHFALYRWDRQGPAAELLVSNATPNFTPGMVISDRGAISFSRDGGRIFFGLAPPPPPDAAANADAAPNETAVVDLWHWKDDYIQPMQKVRASQDRSRSYRAVFDLGERKLTPLADETLQNVTPTRDGRWALGTDDRSYRTLAGVDTVYSDYFLVNTGDGSRRPLLKRHRGAVNLSPTGGYGVFFSEQNWHVLSIPDGGVRSLTGNLGVKFWQEEFDSPSTPPSYGIADWTSDERYVLINDRYDIWQLATDGSGAQNLTDGIGRRDKIVFRYVALDEPDDDQRSGIDPARPLLLKAVNEWTRDEGFYRDRIGGREPEKLVMAAKSFGLPTKAKAADVVVVAASTFTEFPDLLVTTTQFREMKKVSDANPQKAQLLWGTAELVRYRNTDGVLLSAILRKPENFDPAKKYPMMVYIYERLSQNFHGFVNPAPSHRINASYYVSNGYLVLEPDIVYTIGYPGQSALKCVLPAVQSVVDRGFVDEQAIGIQGHSWGGYQIAYMVTQTNRFKAAAPGAVVANMTSAYSGIRWGTGLARQFQYEHTQSRIGGTIWEYPMRFIENSPLFQLDRVRTPMLSIHNDGDDAVPWYQGIEFYLGLRRLGKEVYLFNYNGEPHGLRKRVNQKDYTRRLQEFFDHFLKGAAKPDWMEKGVPFLQRDRPAARSSGDR